MTEKRFIAINDATTNDWELHDQMLKRTTLSTNAIGITRLLNELSEENEYLKQRVTDLNKLLKSKTIGISDGKITKVKTEEFIRICQENMKLNDFIKKLADDTGWIDLMNGYGYHISDVINDE